MPWHGINLAEASVPFSETSFPEANQEARRVQTKICAGGKGDRAVARTDFACLECRRLNLALQSVLDLPFAQTTNRYLPCVR